MKRFLAVLVGCLLLMSVSASAAGAKTIHLFAKQVTSDIFDPNGNPISATTEPTVGAYFLSTDNDYVGNHSKHAKKPIGTDHLDCTILDPVTFTVRCDAQIAFADGMIIVDRQTVSFTVPKQVFKITGGTGKYRSAKGGTVTSSSPSQTSNNNDLVIRY